MKRRMAPVLCLLLLFALGCAERPSPAQSDVPAAELPSFAAGPMTDYDVKVGDLDFDTVTLDGRAIRAGVIREYDLVMVNCWADWCGPCVRELPELERLHQAHPNVLILGLLCNPNSTDDAKAILKDAGVTYPALMPGGSLAGLENRLAAYPTTFFFDSTGHEIADPIVGARSYAEWNSIAEDLLP